MVEIPKIIGPRKRNQQPSPGWGIDASGEVYVRCACGIPMGLEHEVAVDGSVSPSLWHDDPKCGWHVTGRFMDWNPQHSKGNTHE